ncbi:penicillin-binding transpeptidase domain-containing protein [Exiguobacterium flavidum]|uniref:penicillin-binding transpeptidase domain-containing protein n=1 Tax=Exiguobacterium flavidum TaxID=2184695 RepID=UPI000DF749C9|nr:penicillin-binding transpeptidase domain-containing protein [Exiguobacterium flavidum]
MHFSRLVFASSLLILGGCSVAPTPEERLDDYIALWQNEKFSQMYKEFVSQETIDAYGKDGMVTRSEKLFSDLEIDDIDVTRRGEITEKDGTATAQVNVKFKTIAGPVSFKQEVRLVEEEKSGEENWYVDWNPSHLFEKLEADDKVQLSFSPAARGEITDRNGNKLAAPGRGYEVGLVAGAKAELIASVAKDLGISTDAAVSALEADWVQDGQFVPLKTLPPAKKSLAERLEKKGAVVKETAVRDYPYGKSLSHLIGYTGAVTAEDLEKNKDYRSNDTIGKRGLEQVLDERLRGESGVSIVINKKDADAVTVAETSAKEGESIALTIDAELQKRTYAEMKEDPGAAAAVDPSTGETLALVSSPGFDPSVFTGGVSRKQLGQLETDPDKPLLNRFSSAFAPGSTQKPLTAAIGLTASKLDREKAYDIDGLKWKKDGFTVTRIHETPDPVNLRNALVFSDNIYFARAALEIGKDDFVDGLGSFGYGEKLPYVYPLRPSQVSNDGKINTEGQLMDTSYGQGQMLTNILHLASMYEVFLNDGTIYRPTLLLDEEKGRIYKEGLLSKADATLLRQDLRAVVTDGYDLPADIEEVDVSGKTGTAELKTSAEEKGQENGFFVGYDDENPKLLIAMMIESVNEGERGSPYVSGLVANVLASQKE